MTMRPGAGCASSPKSRVPPTAEGSRWEHAIAAAHRAVEHARPIATGYLEAWTQAQRSPDLRAQLAAHYREFRSATAAIAISAEAGKEGPSTDVEALSAVLVAVADGLIVQWLLEPDAVPDPDRLARALAPLLATAMPRPDQI